MSGGFEDTSPPGAILTRSHNGERVTRIVTVGST
jgi:hypothetical protein